MPTAAQEALLWPRIQVTWTTPTSDAIWQRLSVGQEIPQELLSQVVRETQNDAPSVESKPVGVSSQPVFKAARLLYALPTDRAIDPRYARLYTFQHNSRDDIFWYLTLLVAPESKPPDVIVAADQNIGGLSGLSQLLNDVIDAHTPIGLFDTRFAFDVNGWSCKALEQNMLALYGQSFDKFGTALKSDHMSFDVIDGVGGLESMTLGRNAQDNQFWCEFSVRTQITRATQPWFSAINSLCRDVQDYFFRYQEAR